MSRKLSVMICPKCYAEIADDSAFCSECGARLHQNGHPADSLYAHGSDPAVYPEITKANLLRMQGKWEEAVDVCIGILRRYPNNETAHVLLGDIYADQGKYDDAIQWYELVVGLEPDNPTYQVKLERLREFQAAKATQVEAPTPETRPPAGWMPSQRTWVYLLLGAIGLALTISAFVSGWRMGQNEAGGIVLSSQGRSLTGGAPFPPEKASSPGNGATPASPNGTGPNDWIGNPSPSVAVPGDLSTAQEIEFLNQLAQAANFPASRLRVAYNPVMRRWIVRALLDSGMLSRERVLRTALMIGGAAWQQPALGNEAQGIIVTFVVPGKQATDLLFVADLPRTLPDPKAPVNEISTFAQMLTHWWNPMIQVSP